MDRQPGLRRSLRERWKRLNGTAESDGVATGLVVLAMEETGTDAQTPALRRGVAWLQQHQQAGGNWMASSLNADRDPESDIGRFMSDAATGYAVMALEAAPKTTNTGSLR
jgi:squalene-hopene/tetraprenyl-beta-curcumene cyclase